MRGVSWAFLASDEGARETVVVVCVFVLDCVTGSVPSSLPDGSWLREDAGSSLLKGVERQREIDLQRGGGEEK